MNRTTTRPASPARSHPRSPASFPVDRPAVHAPGRASRSGARMTLVFRTIGQGLVADPGVD